MPDNQPKDIATAEAFADSWNNLPEGSVYSREQFIEWMQPLSASEFENKKVLELGCGNASLLVHAASWKPALLEGVDLGSSVRSAERNMKATGFHNYRITRHDLITFQGEGYDLVYCIGVLHHLKSPQEGLLSVVRNVKPGGRFHCWVYAREGNGIIVWVVDPIRKVASKLPWWFTKYLIATPLVVPYFLYAKTLKALKGLSFLKALPLYDYSQWIAERGFSFFRHVAFDQLVTPQTVYITRKQVQDWLAALPQIEKGSEYVIFRNGNSWKFGAKLKD